jgi:Kef-type K+ transport system membrane component KefB
VLQLAVRGGAHPASLALSVALALGFLAVSVWLGIRLAPRLISLVQRLRTRGVLVSVAFLFCIAMAVAAKELGLAEIVGAFAAGLVLASTNDREDIRPPHARSPLWRSPTKKGAGSRLSKRRA